jgi:hypothetical protein
MATFNIIGAASKGYNFAWNQRRVLLHYGFWPIMLKIASFSVIGFLGYEHNILRQGLLLLPANFFEGWLIVIAIRFAMFGENVPEPLNPKTGGLAPGVVAARRAILGGALIYTLANLCASFAGGLLIMVGQLPAPEKPLEPTVEAYLATMIFIACVIYMFRFLWLHVPVAMEIPVQKFLRSIAGFNSSLYMLGLWLLCMMPFLLFFSGFQQILVSITAGSVAGVVLYSQLMLFVRAFFEIVIAIVAGLAMAFAVREILSGNNDRKI